MHVNPIIDRLLRAMNHPSLPGIDLSLLRMQVLLAKLDHPELNLPPVIHLAGTNGKGSTLAFLRAIMQAAGLRVHAYTSPHLVRFNERIHIAGTEISDTQLLPLLQRVAESKIDATFFEATTAAAFLSYAQAPADILLLETGLGGRLDATNVVPKPLATVITPIGFDHMEFLGDTLPAIAREKAGIMKPGVPCVVAFQPLEVQETLIAAAQTVGCPLLLGGRDWVFASGVDHIAIEFADHAWRIPLPSLEGVHQHHNAALASVVAHVAMPEIVTAAGDAGIAHAQWPARLQKLTTGPLVQAWPGEVYLDGGHNAHAANAIAQWVADAPIAILCGMMKRKDAAAFFAPLRDKIAQLVTIPIGGEDCYAPAELAAIACESGINASAASSISEALPLLQDCHAQRLLIVGSLFLAGEILKNHG